MPAATLTTRAAQAGASALAAATLVGVLATEAAAEDRIDRRAGEDRVGTAVELSRAGGEARVAMLASDDAFPDAMSATALAARFDAPVLLTDGEGLSPAASEEIDRIGAQVVVILGGPAAVSEDVEATLRARGLDVERRDGDDRYETAASIARLARAGDEALLAPGIEASWPDAVAGASLAGTDSQPPTLLTLPDRVPEATVEALEDLDVDTVRLLGGEASISDDVADELAAQGYEVTRANGPSRFTTAVAAAELALERLPEGRNPVVASGMSIADAVAGGALAARQGRPFLYVHPDRVDEATHDFLVEHRDRFDGITLVGGPAAVDDLPVEGLVAALDGEEAPQPEPEPEVAESTLPWEGDWAPRHGWSTWERLAVCESDINGTGADWSINTGNGFYGGLQFTLSSWRAVGGSGYPHHASRAEQIYRGEKLQAIQGWGAWPSCSRQVGLR